MDKKTNSLNDLTFYKTHPSPCPYLPNRLETKVLTNLNLPDSEYIYSGLLQAGFRRSQHIAYKAFCGNCTACQSIRVLVDRFTPSKTQKRIIKRNHTLYRKIKPPHLTHTHYKLYQTYINTRHAGEEMANMTFKDIQAMVENTNIDTVIVEYYAHETQKLCGWVLTDLTPYGPSMVYSVFDPTYTKDSLGIYVILNHIELAIDLGVPYLFLGYWVKECQKMMYKTHFKPYELHINHKWVQFQ
ncbi:MAG: arginine-tRNA-protein transferase [Alphaproteobacteria bacterium]|jgi:arginine-tRNA-protein transferase